MYETAAQLDTGCKTRPGAADEAGDDRHRGREPFDIHAVYSIRSHASLPARIPGPARAGGFKADGFLTATRRMGIHHPTPPHKDGNA